jgi:hypothetical protein
MNSFRKVQEMVALVEKPEVKRQLEDLGIDGNIILECLLEK